MLAVIAAFQGNEADVMMWRSSVKDERMSRWMTRSGWVLSGAMLLAAAGARAEVCTTQSQMQPAEREALASTSRSLALKIQANDQDGVKSMTVPEYAANFAGMGNAVSTTSPKLAGDTPVVEQVYVLDASANKKNDDGSFPSAEFICTLNKSTSEADFSISSLPPGRYAFSMVQFSGPAPWMLSMLLRQDGATAPWKLAGLFPKESSAAGHDGLWYWSQGRTLVKDKQPWVAYIYYQEAQNLLRPAGFVSSTHLENLRSESAGVTPPEIGDGISQDAPLIVKDVDGKIYKFSSIVPDDSLHKDKLDVAAHMIVDPSITDQSVVTKMNMSAMAALLAQHPELRQNFHGMWVFAEAQGRAPFVTEAAMNEIH